MGDPFFAVEQSGAAVALKGGRQLRMRKTQKRADSSAKNVTAEGADAKLVHVWRK
jgi:hypothetical protein